MPRTNIAPMTDKDYHDCNAALKDLDRIIKELDIALQGGAPCEGQIDGCKELVAKYQQWKAAYWNDRP